MKYLIAGLALLLSCSNIFSQNSCGFGCLGLSGIYGGYSYENYNASGFNNYLNSVNYDFGEGYVKDDGAPQFGRGAGFRIGVNLFRAKFKTFFLTTKVFYQFLKESGSIHGSLDGGERFKDVYDLNLNHAGIAFDFGMPVYKILDVKILEAGIVIMKSELVNTMRIDDEIFYERKYERSPRNVDYYLGSGLIFHAIPNYVSLEGTAAYNFYNVQEMEDDSGSKLSNSATGAPVDNFIETGKFSYTVQINIGIPI
ncbi:MAG TPA: hypothetical protein VHO28_13070 [Ignavibacteriales bacterium]|nr:hypothetical protein [Ignavibacteriales bacterium]